MSDLKPITADKVFKFSGGDILRLLASLTFLAVIYYMVRGNFGGSGTGSTLLIIAAVIGGYMAMNIGANDVANNVGPAVGSEAITLTGAILIAVICEAGGALIAGGDVVSTIKKGIIDPEYFGDNIEVFIWAMTAALLAAAVWLNIATWLGAPVSTTHSIVGGVMGAGIAAAGTWAIADWVQVQKIVASWVISPVMGGVIAATFLYSIKRFVLYQTDMRAAAQKAVPVLLAIMAWAFSTYLILKGMKKIIKIDFVTALGIGFAFAIVIYFVIRMIINKRAESIENTREGIDRLFVIPLIVGAALLSFAHGANDVANAVGPLAAINEAVMGNGISDKAAIHLWVMLIGAAGIAIGLALYGPKLIKTVGSEITELDKTRAFCVALAAAITVIIASQLGLPVSSTHIAVGGIFGVGFLRESLQADYSRTVDKIRTRFADKDDLDVGEEFIERFESSSMVKKKALLRELKSKAKAEEFSWSQRRQFKKAYKAKLVERKMLYKIIAAWIFTVPVTGIFAAMLFYMIRGMLVA